MSPRTWRERIQDILEAMAEIETFTRGMDYETFQADEKTVRAVEMNFIIIGEAASQIPDEVEEAHPHIPWYLMRAMRNRLAHVYFSVDERLLWETVHDQLPELTPLLEKLLNS
jgi:uncharacterized protein with HEPN domain